MVDPGTESNETKNDLKLVIFIKCEPRLSLRVRPEKSRPPTTGQLHSYSHYLTGMRQLETSSRIVHGYFADINTTFTLQSH